MNWKEAEAREENWKLLFKMFRVLLEMMKKGESYTTNPFHAHELYT